MIQNIPIAADVVDPKSGRRLQLFTSEPGVQLYTGNFLDGTVKGKAGKIYPHWGAFTLETQHYPKLADGMGKTQNRSGDEARACQR